MIQSWLNYDIIIIGGFLDRTNGKAGRPRGRKNTSKIDVPIEPGRKAEFKRIVERNGTTAAAKIRELITEYIKKQKQE